MDLFTKRVIQVIQAIPPGRVMTYGQIARFADKPYGARQVSWILHSMSRKYELPWHRVINAKGGISLSGSEQRELLELEGVIFNKNGKVDLHTYEWIPGDLDDVEQQ